VALKRILTGAALNSHLVRFWNTIKQRYEELGGQRINYLTHALILAVHLDGYPTKEQEIRLAALLAEDLQKLFPKDADLPRVILYLENRGWEDPDEGLIYGEDGDPIYASTIMELFDVYKLMPLRWGLAKHLGPEE
jgi:hypothetical protein